MPSSILGFFEAEVTLCFVSRAALRWALVISPREPLTLKDGVRFTMVHKSFYGVCIFGGWKDWLLAWRQQLSGICNQPANTCWYLSYRKEVWA